jgi:hypothetical protein
MTGRFTALGETQPLFVTFEGGFVLILHRFGGSSATSVLQSSGDQDTLA